MDRPGQEGVHARLRRAMPGDDGFRGAELMSKRDYYEVLGVARDCTEVELKAAFRKLAMQHHPDRNPGDNECEHKFKEINEAYDVLKDGDKRAAYDRFGHAAFEHGGMGGRRTASAPISAPPSPTFSKAFSACRGARGRASGRERGSDLRYNMEIGLEEAFAGKTAQIRIPTSVTCEACSGTGAKPGTKPKACATCGGAGRVRHAQGFFTLERTCPACQGRGQVIDDPCPELLGRRPGDARAHAFGQYPGRRRGRHPHQACRRRRGRPARRPGRRSLYFPLDHPARVLPARRRRPALPGADLHGDGGAGRRVRGAGDRRQQGAGQGALRHPDRPPLPACRPRACRCCGRNKPATCMFRSSWKRRRT